MATSRLNNITVSGKAVADQKRFIRKTLPVAADLVAVSQIESTRRRNFRLEKLENKITVSYTKALNNNLNRTVAKITERGLAQQVVVLKKIGFKISKKRLREIQNEANFLFFDRTYFGRKPKRRGKVIAKKAVKNIIKETRRLRTHSSPLSEAKRLVNKVRGGKVRGFSYARSSKRLLVSETHRAQASVIQFFSQKIGTEFLRWVTVGDGRVTALDRVRSQDSDLSNAEKRSLTKLGISWRGVYHTASIPGMIRHVGCRCTLSIIPGPSFRKKIKSER